MTSVATPLYHRLILDHYRRPRNRGTLEDATHAAKVDNPMCGDELVVQLRVHHDVVQAAVFSGRGCAISQATASLMTEALSGRSLDHALELGRRFGALMRGEEGAANHAALGELRDLAGIARFPMRVPCALLPWEALEQAVPEAGERAAVEG